MVRIRHSAGNGSAIYDDCIMCVTVWNLSFNQRGSLKFFEGDITNIAEFALGSEKDEILLITYPFNNKKKLTDWAEAHENEVRDLIALGQKDNPGQQSVLVDIEAGILLKPDRFNRYSARINPEDDMFIFDNPDPKVGWPKVFVHERFQRNSPAYGDVFPVVARASRFAYPTISKPTDDGKAFTYMLANSFLKMAFDPYVPNLAGVHFPTRMDNQPPMKLNTEELEKFLIHIGVDKITISDGKLKIGDTLSDEEPDVVEEMEDEDDDFPVFNFGANDVEIINNGLSAEGLKALIMRQITEKESFNLGDAFNFGFEALLNLIPISDKIITAVDDFPGLIRKMCVHKGMFHIIPLGDQIERVAEILDMDDKSIKVCTEETFPRKNTPLLPKPADNL